MATRHGGMGPRAATTGPAKAQVAQALAETPLGQLALKDADR